MLRILLPGIPIPLRLCQHLAQIRLMLFAACAFSLYSVHCSFCCRRVFALSSLARLVGCCKASATFASIPACMGPGVCRGIFSLSTTACMAELTTSFNGVSYVSHSSSTWPTDKGL